MLGALPSYRLCFRESLRASQNERMTETESRPPDSRPFLRRQRHLGQGVLVILLTTYFAVAVTAMVAGGVGGWTTPGTVSVLTDIGAQTAEDSSWLLPTLVATLALLVGVPLAQGRIGEDDPNVSSRRVALSSYAVAGLAWAGVALALFGSIGHPETARRLWSMIVICLVGACVALWTGGMVFGSAGERRRIAARGYDEALRHIERMTAAGWGPERPGRSLVRVVVFVLISITIVSSAIALVGVGSLSAHDLIPILGLCGEALVAASVPLTLALVACLERTDLALPPGLRRAFGVFFAGFSTLLSVALVSSLAIVGISTRFVIAAAVTQIVPLAWSLTSRRWGPWTLVALTQQWQLHSTRITRLNYQLDLRALPPVE